MFKKYMQYLLALIGLFSSLFAMKQDHPEFLSVKAVHERHIDTLMGVDGVVATGIGFNDHNQVAIKVFVRHSQVSNIPALIEGKPVHVVVSGQIKARRYGKINKGPPVRVDPRDRFSRPVPTGVSTGHYAITAGTIGCMVTDGLNYYLLSNNHVLANENHAAIGDKVLQPGPYDKGSVLDDVVAELSMFRPISFFPGSVNSVDAALALTSKEFLTNETPEDGYGLPKRETILAELDMPVQKYGRTTSLTKGKVAAIGATVDVQYDDGIARFVNQIIVTPGNFSAPGDSGSLIVAAERGKDKANDRRPVGLLFAGSQTVTIANPIDDVLEYFGVEIDGE